MLKFEVAYYRSSTPMISPPDRVPREYQTSGSIVSRTNRTLPSSFKEFIPPGCRLAHNCFPVVSAKPPTTGYVLASLRDENQAIGAFARVVAPCRVPFRQRFSA